MVVISFPPEGEDCGEITPFHLSPLLRGDFVSTKGELVMDTKVHCRVQSIVSKVLRQNSPDPLVVGGLVDYYHEQVGKKRKPAQVMWEVINMARAKSAAQKRDGW